MGQVKLEMYLQSQLGEGALWDNRKKILYWVDIIRKQVHAYNPANSTNKTFILPQMVGSVVPCEDDSLLLALEHGFFFLELNTEKIEKILDPEADIPENRFNDGKCDPSGRFWAGTLNMQDLPNRANLYRLDPDGTCTKKIDNVSNSNGICWDEKNSKMYYIDTPTRRIWSYDYSTDSGDIQNRQTAVIVDPSDGYPDGMTIDSEGMIWVAHWDGWKIIRYNPRDGKKLLEITLPTAKITSCTFGGEDLQTLYITTASIGLTKKAMRSQPLAGGLFSIKTDFTGIPAYFFKREGKSPSGSKIL
jgi:sugar lactone lactonase YvrE